ncbi:hypothetical protein M9979_05435 [Sphingomonas sp. RP10(2022)]|uniref:Lipoprotein n=1 Tax=Sphingomonas liriopis TaxID=2949094 RepID=A0A9X2KPW1_9SPHN|nr:hypothetical protein [Sphingomonas liriopis]MCP3734320.1 hypothetical protein [Sphingomonas liriopis]
MRSGVAGVAMAAVLLAGCGERDYGDLPRDERTRAILCMRAGVLALGNTAQGGTAEAKQRLADKVRQLGEVTRLQELVPGAKDDMLAALGGEKAVTEAVQAVWLTPLNQCFAAYDIAAEPVPSLPAAPYERATTCAAAVAIDAARGKAIDPGSAVVYDPQGFYFAWKAAHDARKPPLDAANAAVDAMKPLVRNGAAQIFAAACRKEDAKATTAMPRPLPADPVVAGVICSSTLGALRHGGLAVGAGDTAAARSYAAGAQRVAVALGRLSVDAAAVTAAYTPAAAYVAATGNAAAVADACLKRFPG